MSLTKMLLKVGDYAPIDAFRVPPLTACPCCGSAPVAWRYHETQDHFKVVICCTTGEAFGPQIDGSTNAGCPLYMPPSDFYHDRIKEAAEYWNHYAAALTALRDRR